MYKLFYVRCMIQPLYNVSSANHEFRKSGFTIGGIFNDFIAHDDRTY
jgi:hypothetical protein